LHQHSVSSSCPKQQSVLEPLLTNCPSLSEPFSPELFLPLKQFTVQLLDLFDAFCFEKPKSS